MVSGLYPEIDFHLQFTPYTPCSLRGRRLTLPPLDDVELLYVFGIAEDFSSLAAWLSKNPLRKAVLLEDDLGALAALWEKNSFLPHPQIFPRFLPSRNRAAAIASFACEFPIESCEVVSIDRYRRRLPSLKLALKRQTIVWHALLMESLHAPYFYRNLFSNLSRLPQSFLVNGWRGRFQDVPAVICGAGPSLEMAAPVLRQVHNRALVIAGGSALSALSHLGVRPHLGLAVDPNAREYDAVKKCTARDIPLLYCSRVFPRVFEIFQGPLGYIRAGTGGALEEYFEEKLGIDAPKIGSELGPEALSVTTLAAALAQALGCNPIIFAGVDLAYTGNRMYAPGVATEIPPASSIKRKDRLGHPIATKVEWIMEAAALGRFARLYPDTAFFNASEGIPIGKIPYRSLETVLQKTYSLDFSTETMKLPSPAPFLQELSASLERCRRLTVQLSESHPESGHAAVLQYDLEEEVAYPPLLREISFAYRLRYPREPLWPFLTKAINAYIDGVCSATCGG